MDDDKIGTYPLDEVYTLRDLITVSCLPNGCTNEEEYSLLKEELIAMCQHLMTICYKQEVNKIIRLKLNYLRSLYRVCVTPHTVSVCKTVKDIRNTANSIMILKGRNADMDEVKQAVNTYIKLRENFIELTDIILPFMV